jgi:hypothetical protein
MKLCVLFLCLSTFAGVVPANSTQSESAADRTKRFRASLHQYLQVGAMEEITDLVKRNSEEAVWVVIDDCLTIERESSDELENEIDALRRAWHKAFESEFVNNVYEYFSLSPSAIRRERQRLQAEFDKEFNLLMSNMEAKEPRVFEQCALTFARLAGGFAEVGDRYHASESWLNYAYCWDETYRGQAANHEEAIKGFQKSIAERKAIDLEDFDYVMASDRIKAISGRGFGTPSDGGESATGEAGEASAAPEPTAAAASLTAPLSFQVVALEQFERPNFSLDEIYALWPQVGLTKKGSKAKIEAMSGKCPEFLRVGSNEIFVDGNGDGTGDVEVPIVGEPVVTEFEIAIGEAPRRWAFLSRPGVDQELYQDIQVNLQPNDDYFPLYVLSAASMTGVLNGVPVRIIDDNMDGLYGSYPLYWAYWGVSEGLSQPEMDCMVIGESKRAVPWSGFQKIGEQWYQLEALKAGTELKATPVQVQTGTLRLEYKGPKPTWLVVKGREKIDTAYYDLAAAGKNGVEVPAGTYELVYGEIRQGKRRQVMKAVILPNQGRSQNWVVKPGAVTVAKLGEPYGFDFKYEVGEDSLTVLGKSVTVIGSAGERYERLWNCRSKPEVAWRKKGSNRGSKGEAMEFLNDQEQLYKDFGASYRPLDKVIQEKLPPEGIEVQLSEKKNKLFGSIESDWRG